MTFSYRKGVDIVNDRDEWLFTLDTTGSPTWQDKIEEPTTSTPWRDTTITTVTFDESFTQARPTTTRAWFSRLSRLTSIQGIENLNTDSLTSMSGIFSGCTGLKEINVGNLQMGSIDISQMQDCFAQVAPAYNLSGQRVDNAYKGIVIRNARKYVSK